MVDLFAIAYRKALRTLAGYDAFVGESQDAYCKVTAPLKGVGGIGKQLAWLKRETEGAIIEIE